MAHSLKGAARAVDATFMEVIAHGLENVFAAAKQGEIITTPVIFDTLYEALDQISASLETLGSAEEADNDPTELRERLDKAAKGDPSASQKKIPVNASKKKPKSTKASGSSAKKAEETIRVSTRKLDGLMTHVEELLVSKIRNEQRLSELKEIKGFLGGWQKSWAKTRIAFDRIRKHSDGELDEITSFLGENQQNLKFMWHLTNKLFQNYSRDTMRMSLVTEDLQSDIRGVRMLPVSIIFDGYRRMVRDLAREQGKQVDLVITGSDTELDKKVVEGIKDPLMHMLRNSVDHGIEKPDARVAKGKPPCGTIWLEASQRGNGIAIEVKDDGRGVDIERIKNTVLARGILSSQEIKAMNEDDLQQMIFRSGFSTSTTVSSLSGRGVGLDVVKTNIEELNGLVSVYKGEPCGTRFLIELPLTLSTSRVLLISCRGETYAIPTSAVERIVRINKKDIFSVGTKETITVSGRSLSLARLGPLLELPRHKTRESDDTLNVIIVGVAEKRVAIAVDFLEGENEIVIKSLGKMMARVRNVS
ncbi:MAG: chemotaxis protein CheW, partial [Actinomycetia bacterium]|nr:chemotaxis protein CheW [Actinomycetes bacterium]